MHFIKDLVHVKIPVLIIFSCFLVIFINNVYFLLFIFQSTNKITFSTNNFPQIENQSFLLFQNIMIDIHKKKKHIVKPIHSSLNRDSLKWN